MVTTYSLVKNIPLDSSLKTGLFPFGDCSQVCFFIFNWVLIVFEETWRTLKAVVFVEVQIVAVSELAAVLVIRRVVKHWGLLLLWESDLENSREKEQRKTRPVSFFSCLFAFSNKLNVIIAFHFEMEVSVAQSSSRSVALTLGKCFSYLINRTIFM